MLLLVQGVGHFNGALDVTLLCGFVAAHQKQVDRLATTSEIDPVTRATMNPHFGDALSNRLAITKIAMLRSTNAVSDAGSALCILECRQPRIKLVGALEIDHGFIVSDRIRLCKLLCLPIRHCRVDRARASVKGVRAKIRALLLLSVPSPMNLVINGESRDFSAPLSVAALLEALGYAGKRIAVERNGEIVPKSLHGETALVEGDKLEIVVAVGGG